MPLFSCFPFLKNIRRKKVKHSSVFISYQGFSLPWPIIRYLCSNGNYLNQLKLFSTCQQLKNRILKNKKNFAELNILKGLRFNWYKPNCLQMSYSLISEEKLKFLQPIKVKVLSVNLMGYEDLEMILFAMLKILNLHEISCVHFSNVDAEWGHMLDINILKPVIVPSVNSLYLGPFLKLKNGDILYIALTELPNLEMLTMYWQDGITNLSNAALIPRKRKLNLFELSWVNDDVTPQIISNFIINQMSDSSVTNFYVNPVSDVAAYACECYQTEINETISKQLKNAKFTFNRLFGCQHP